MIQFTAELLVMFEDLTQKVWTQIFLGSKVLRHIPDASRLKINYTRHASQSFIKDNIFSPRITVNQPGCKAVPHLAAQISLPPQRDLFVFLLRQIRLQGRHHRCSQALRFVWSLESQG